MKLRALLTSHALRCSEQATKPLHRFHHEGSELFVPPESTEPPGTTEAPTTTLAPTTTVLAGLPVELTDCANPPEGFEILCDAYRLMDEHYVDPISDEVLAAGAIRGIEDFEPENPAPPATGEIECAMPTDAFEHDGIYTLRFDLPFSRCALDPA